MFYEFQHLGVGEYTKKYTGESLDFPSHLHQSFELILPTSGKMEVVVDKKKSILKAGEAVLVFPNQIHSLCDIDSKHLLYIFSPEIVKAFISEIAGKIPENNKFTPSPSLIKALQSSNEKTSLFEKKGMLYTLCSEFHKSAEYTHKKEEEKDSLVRIFNFVEESYNKDASLETLSNTLGFSYSYLSRYFKKAVGISFNSYVNQYKISKACYLLIYSDYSVLQCALESGYESLRSFNRNFYLIHSMSPSEYRRKKRSTT